MNFRGFNWPLWGGLVLSLIALLSYPFFFVWFPITRDFPWANLILFGLAMVLAFVGVRRSFSKERAHSKRSKIIGSLVGGLSLLIVVLFLFSAFVFARWLPASKAAPQVGQQAPDFSLPDTTGRMVALSELRAAPINGKPAKGVLLIFYRGYW